METPVGNEAGPPTTDQDVTPAFLAQSLQPNIYAACIVVTLAATSAVALRLLCRRLAKAYLWWDDWMIVAALTRGSTEAMAIHLFCKGEFFYDETNRPAGYRIDKEQSLIATQTIYFCAQALVKVSILLLYHRLFGVVEWFRIALCVAGALTIMWWIAAILDSIFQCVPVQAIWDKSIRDPKCQDVRASALGTGISNMILDIMFLIIPLPMIWKLQVTRKIKISLTGIFLLGAFVCATSAVRIHAIYKTDWTLTDPSWTGFGLGVWSTVESCCSVIAACLPTMRPLLTRAQAHTSHAKSTSTKSLRTLNFVSSGSKGGPLSPIWSPPSPSSPRKAPYQSLDEYLPDLENGDSSFGMKKSPRTWQNARFDSHATYANPSPGFGQDRPFHSTLRSEEFGKENPPLSLLEPRYVGPARFGRGGACLHEHDGV
ncbi:hypothetical protein HO133_009739 [Letharia lupina]|uniref:Rhodopsin domain-containing protein n=1 Tax=Letharia lupina TaxID=560253 RepID=A0A8H6CLK0_9LECA|nr:uncharacterized protein HO133_009739 [Letharia lupina]KAF6225737.1 hypothetical protein HO133_009739 [Letharia lupina]